MEERKLSLKNIMTETISSINGKCRRVFASSTMQYVAFLLTYFFTRSFLISFVVYALFIPSQVAFLKDVNGSAVESVFKIGKRFVPSLLISMLFVFVFGAGIACVVVPGVIFFANYAFVFDVASEGEQDCMNCFKQSRELAKGYRGKVTLLFLIFLLALSLCIGFTTLLFWLFSLFIPALTYSASLVWSFVNVPLFVYFGIFVGVSAFLIFVLPVELLAISNLRGAIENDKIAKSMAKEADNSKAKEPEKVNSEDVDITPPSDDDVEPSDYIF